MKEGTLTHDKPARDAPPDGVTPPASLELDPDKYRAHLEAFDLSEEQENELLAVLWHIMRSFVEIGFGLDSVQLFSTGEPGPQAEITGLDSGKALEETSSPQHFNRAAEDRGTREEASSCQTE